jgi:hypothetical protein
MGKHKTPDADLAIERNLERLGAAGCKPEDIRNLRHALLAPDPQSYLRATYDGKTNRNLALFAIPGAGGMASLIAAFQIFAQSGTTGGANEAEALGGIAALVAASGVSAWRIWRRVRRIDAVHEALLGTIEEAERGRKP